MQKTSTHALLEAAAHAARQAHAPYSHYRVGAALRAGPHAATWTGCNVENASYGLTNCAERTALFKAISEGARTFTELAIVASGPALPVPCGACRQVLAEFCPPTLRVVVAIAGALDQYETYTLGELLPHAFSLPQEHQENDCAR